MGPLAEIEQYLIGTPRGYTCYYITRGRLLRERATTTHMCRSSRPESLIRKPEEI
jgi:hypothetical protein